MSLSKRLTILFPLPAGTTAIPSATQSAVAGTTDPTVHEYAAVQITQIPGYTSWVSKNGAAAVAQTTIPAEASGSDDETYDVTYVANQASITVNYVDYFGNTISQVLSLRVIMMM
ncbi:hypothetical protein [Paucilactobacillus hokkaidonensis]|uniref:hypothetical protein n=1 Tax=Paucilactobacillus hokkaidonensis TaxID=1193095 RepID=UPI002091EFE5|nr:hypothetical protein [Paucilactobacillus hokkaidonensis]